MDSTKLMSPVRGCILADAMGLGKTRQAVCTLFLMAERRSTMTPREAMKLYGPNKPTLILTPSQLISTWVEELNAFLPGTFEIIMYDKTTKREQYLKQTDRVFKSVESAAFTVVVSSYEIFQRRHSEAAFGRAAINQPFGD